MPAVVREYGGCRGLHSVVTDKVSLLADKSVNCRIEETCEQHYGGA